MPILNVQIMQGHNATSKTELLKKLTQSVVDSIGAPLASIRAVLQEVSSEHVIVAGEIGKEMVMITVGLIRGRTEDQKAALIAALFEATEQAIGVSKQNIRVILFDRPAIDFGVAGGVTAKAAGR
jgi:4-oxalocrotonate tautomerase